MVMPIHSRSLPALCIAAITSSAGAGIVVEPGTWQSTYRGTVVPAGRVSGLPGNWVVESPGTAAAPPQYWKVVETSPRRPDPSQQPSGGGGGGPSRSVSYAPPPTQRVPVKTSINGVDIWVRIPALMVQLPTFKLALPDPIGSAGRPPTTGQVGGDGVSSTIGPPRDALDHSWSQTPYGRSMIQQYPYLARSSQQWQQERDRALRAPVEQRPAAVQQFLREAGMLQQVRRTMQPRVYSVPRQIIAPSQHTNLQELDPKLIEDNSVQGQRDREEARIASLSGMEKAVILRDRGDLVAARQELSATVEQFPEDGTALSALTVLHLASRQDGEAVLRFIQALHLSPAFADLDESAWGLSGPAAAEAATRLTAQAKRTGGTNGAQMLLLAANLRASQGQITTARRLAEQAWDMDQGKTLEDAVLGLMSLWPDSSPPGNRKAKPAS